MMNHRLLLHYFFSYKILPDTDNVNRVESFFVVKTDRDAPCGRCRA